MPGVEMKNRYQPLAALLVTVASLILGGYLLFNSLRGTIREMVNADLAAIATLKSRQVVQWFEDRDADAGSLAVDSFFARAVDRWYAEVFRNDRQREMIVKRLNGFISQHRFDAAVLLDGQGRPVLRVGEGPHDTRHAQAQIALAMASNETVFVDMHRHEDEAPELDFISPLRIEGRIVGALYLMEDADGTSSHYWMAVQTWPGWSKRIWYGAKAIT